MYKGALKSDLKCIWKKKKKEIKSSPEERPQIVILDKVCSEFRHIHHSAQRSSNCQLQDGGQTHIVAWRSTLSSHDFRINPDLI